MIHTKIIATVGPASEAEGMLGALLDAGVDVFRLNFSHGTLEQHARVYERIRAVSAQRGRLVAVMGDLCGPKIRVDPVEDDAFSLAAGDRIDIVAGHVVGNRGRISTNRPELVREVRVGQRVLIDDGTVRLRVEAAAADRLACVCEVGGVVSTRKGVNLPDSRLAMSALTEKDREDLSWAVAHGVDYLAMSFVRTAADLRELRDSLPLAGDRCRVVAKIETATAVGHLDEIIEAADVVLVARGDLGVEMDLSRVPIVQKQITRRCLAAGKPVIVATQMLQSMVSSPTATRAEVSDVANAILDRADAIMLSAETSIGAYPVESVQMMARIAAHAEAYVDEAGRGTVEAAASLRPVATAVAHAAHLLAGELDARAVAVWTQTGNTARLLSKCRLSAPIAGLSPEEHVCRRMCLYYGVIPVQLARAEQIVHMLRDVDDALLQRGLARPGELIVVVAGTRLEQVGSTNALLIHLLGSTDAGMPEITG
jgi:pyruvate kinase